MPSLTAPMKELYLSRRTQGPAGVKDSLPAEDVDVRPGVEAAPTCLLLVAAAFSFARQARTFVSLCSFR